MQKNMKDWEIVIIKVVIILALSITAIIVGFIVMIVGCTYIRNNSRLTNCSSGCSCTTNIATPHKTNNNHSLDMQDNPPVYENCINNENDSDLPPYQDPNDAPPPYDFVYITRFTIPTVSLSINMLSQRDK